MRWDVYGVSLELIAGLREPAVLLRSRDPELASQLRRAASSAFFFFRLQKPIRPSSCRSVSGSLRGTCLTISGCGTGHRLLVAAPEPVGDGEGPLAVGDPWDDRVDEASGELVHPAPDPKGAPGAGRPPRRRSQHAKWA
jgi:hypothetical protein